jgi:hypothetical protein
MAHVHHSPVGRGAIAKARDDDYIQFCFELYCDALRLSADSSRLSRDWEGVAERMWLEVSDSPATRRCARRVNRRR